MSRILQYRMAKTSGRKTRTATKRPRRRVMYADPREQPLFTVADASHFLNIPATTVAQWAYGRRFKGRDGKIRWSDRLIDPADERRGLLSFFNLAEAHVLQATRDHDIPMAKVRVALDYIRKLTGSKHPLIEESFYTHNKELFIKKLSEIINASRFGQVGFDFLDPYLQRLARDAAGLPFRVFPMRNNPDQLVMLDLNIGSGAPVTHTGVFAEVLAGRYDSGETYEELALDYHLDERTVEHAIRYFKAAA